MSARRRRLVAVAVLVLALVGALLAWRWWHRPPADALLASGTIEATEIHVSFKVAGRVIARAVDEGDRVAPDTLIARLESLDLQAEVDRLRGALRSTESQVPPLRTEIAMQEEVTASRVAEARAALAAREEYLTELRNGSRPQELSMAMAEVRESNATLENAEADLKRMQTLFERDLIAAQNLDSARTAYRVASERHRSAVERYEMMKEGTRQEQLRRADADVRQARAALLTAQTGEIDVVRRRQQLATLEANIERDRAALATAEAQLGYTVLRSPQAGVVLRKHVEPGEIIAAGTPAVTIADLTNIWLKIYVPETQLGRVKLGQRAEIRTDSYPGKSYAGRVIFINSEAEFTPKNVQTQEERVKLVFAVKVAVDNARQELKPGMPADATVRID